MNRNTLRQGYKNVSLGKSKHFDGVGARGARHSLRSQTIKTCSLESASNGQIGCFLGNRGRVMLSLLGRKTDRNCFLSQLMCSLWNPTGSAV